MSDKSGVHNFGIDDPEQWLAERERRDLEQTIERALAPYPPAQRRKLREKLRQSAERRRFEHGGSFVSVLVDDQWLPLERAAAVLAERISG